MSDLAVASGPVAGDARSTAIPIPAELARRLDGHVRPESIVIWAEFDLDESRRYAPQYAVLTDDALVVCWPARVERVALADVSEAGVDESIGSDRLVVVASDGPPRILRYTRA